MRIFTLSLYRFVLRLQGLYALVFLPLTFIGLPSAAALDRSYLVPLLLVGLASAAGFMLALPRRTPRWLAQPTAPGQGLGAALSLGVLALLFALASMAAIVLLALPEPLSRNAAVLSGLGHFFLAAPTVCLALLLGFWPGAAQRPARALPA